MKTTDLMIGDKVQSRTGMVVTIVSISHDSPIQYTPIPLTPEILEKNGWDGIDDYRQYGFASGIFNDDYSCEIGLDSDGRCFLTINTWEYSVCEIKGVHQLQHALRLCGLDDLANNFQID